MRYKAKSIEPALNVLAFHGKSFRFAGRFLNKTQLEDCARLYRFCRFVDDLVDKESNILLAQKKIERLKQNLELDYSQIPVVQDFIELAKHYQMQTSVVSELVKGIESDLTPALIKNEAELLRYCYRVAGTVGLLMCDVLGVKDPKARPHAIDLGIAMQLTNIARDVVEDAKMGRRFMISVGLPARGCETQAPATRLWPSATGPAPRPTPKTTAQRVRAKPNQGVDG